MTWLDWIVAITVAFGAFQGYRKGATQQIIAFAASLAGVLLPLFFTGPLAHSLQKPLGVPYPVSFLFSGVALAVVGYFGLRILWKTVLSRLIPGFGSDDEGGGLLLPSPLDRLGGVLLGTGKSAAVMWILVSVVALVVAGLARQGSTAGGLEKSDLIKISTKHNAVGMALDGRIKNFTEAIRSQTNLVSPNKSLVSPKSRNAMQDLLSDSRFQSVANNDALREALSRGDIVAVAHSPELLSLLNDSGAMKRIGVMVAEARSSVAGFRSAQ